jgi:hypothetical protein
MHDGRWWRFAVSAVAAFRPDRGKIGRMSEQQAVEAIKQAIRNPGSHPAHHREVMERHRKEWPTLWKALDALLADSASPPSAQEGER